MRHGQSRRAFLSNVGRGMVVASVGTSVAHEMGLVSRGWADEMTDRPLQFGDREPLVRFMQETPAAALIPALGQKLKDGVGLQDLLTAAALANARAFGGEDYIGFHTLMALGPAWHMSRELPAALQPLPVFKVLYRNCDRIAKTGGLGKETLRSIEPQSQSLESTSLRDASRKLNKSEAERILATLAQAGPANAFNALLMEVEDETEVHRVALPYRAWDLMGIIGQDHALTFLRQSLRYCVDAEARPHSTATRDALAHVMSEFHLDTRQPGDRVPDDQWVEETARLLLSSQPADAAAAVGAALADGISPDAVTEAAAVAANQILLRDPGRPQKYASDNKPAGSVHGDSIGLHCCDAVNAWRNIARVADDRNRFAAAVLSAYQVARDRIVPGTEGERFIDREALPHAADREQVKESERGPLLAAAEEAIRGRDQRRTVAVLDKLLSRGEAEQEIVGLLRRFAISEDGALHAEKYYRTVTEERATIRPRFRANQLLALGRVTASAFGYPAPGYDETRELLRVS